VGAYQGELTSTPINRPLYCVSAIGAAVAEGAFPVAKAGILKGKRGTTYNQNPLRHDTLRNMASQ